MEYFIRPYTKEFLPYAEPWVSLGDIEGQMIHGSPYMRYLK